MSNKGPNIFLIAAVLLAVIIIGGAVFVAKHNGGTAEEADSTMPATFNGKQVILDDVFRHCISGEHCIVVDTDCGFCCQYTAINARYEDDFNKVFDKSCGRYRGESCKCFDLSSYPACVDGQCQLVKWPNEK